MIARLRNAVRAGMVAFRGSHPHAFQAGPAFAIRCAVVPTDAAIVYADEERGIVGLEIAYPDHSHSIILPPSWARALGAAILNAADTADGTAPLLFVPDSPDGAES